MSPVKLKEYDPKSYQISQPLWRQILWYFIGFNLLKSYLLPSSTFKVFILRCFGAQVGTGVRIKPGIQVKFPWNLTIGNDCWIGEKCWFDNLAPITLSNDVCISQGVYLCTGNHNWKKSTFDLLLGSIELESGTWLAAQSKIGPGVKVGTGAILSFGSVATRSLDEMTIYGGNPAQIIKERVFLD